MSKDQGPGIHARALRISEAPRSPLQHKYLDIKASMTSTLPRKAQERVLGVSAAPLSPLQPDYRDIKASLTRKGREGLRFTRGLRISETLAARLSPTTLISRLLWQGF